MPIVSNRFGVHRAEVATSTAAIVLAVTVQLLVPTSIARNAHAIILPGLITEIVNGDDRTVFDSTRSHERENAPAAIFAIDPLESRRFEIRSVE